MCHVANTSSSFNFDVTVFSTVDVLKGKMWRPWSTALFDAAQELFFGKALERICNRSSEKVICQVSFADSEMARSNGHYRVIAYSGPEATQFGLYGDPSSDEWYRAWWRVATALEAFDTQGSQSYAKWAGQKACEVYTELLRNDPFFLSHPHEMLIPVCNVLPATDLILYVIVDFPAGTSPKLVNYSFPLPESFGKAFSGSPYNGSIILKGSWHDYGRGPTRDVQIYGLRELEFLYDEVRGESRTAAEADTLAIALYSPGQSDKDIPTKDAILGGVANISPHTDGHLLVKLTGGSIWSVSRSCQLSVGDDVVRAYDSNGTPELGDLTQNTWCPNPAFEGSW
jgi:hypothetical protein